MAGFVYLKFGKRFLHVERSYNGQMKKWKITYAVSTAPARLIILINRPIKNKSEQMEKKSIPMGKNERFPTPWAQPPPGPPVPPSAVWSAPHTPYPSPSPVALAPALSLWGGRTSLCAGPATLVLSVEIMIEFYWKKIFYWKIPISNKYLVSNSSPICGDNWNIYYHSQNTNSHFW